MARRLARFRSDMHTTAASYGRVTGDVRDIRTRQGVHASLQVGLGCPGSAGADGVQIAAQPALPAGLCGVHYRENTVARDNPSGRVLVSFTDNK